MAHGWQIVDRPSEFGAVRSALTGGEGCGVVLVGAAGVGKTTLARAVTRSLRSQVHWVACTESSRSIPLGVFAHLVGSSASRDPTALLGIGARIPCGTTRTRVRGCRRRPPARRAVGDAAAPDRRRQRRAHPGDGPHRRTGSRCCHVAVEGRLSAAVRAEAVQQAAERRAGRVGHRRNARRTVRRSDVGVLRRQPVVPAPPGRRVDRRGHVDQGRRCLAAARAHRRSVRIGGAAGNQAGPGGRATSSTP